jgi:hypothetical protein
MRGKMFRDASHRGSTRGRGGRGWRHQLMMCRARSGRVGRRVDQRLARAQFASVLAFRAAPSTSDRTADAAGSAARSTVVDAEDGEGVRA